MAALAVTSAALALGPANAAGRTKVVRYHNSTAWGNSVRAAAKAWNESGARVRFISVRASRARVRIVYLRGRDAVAGRATLRYRRGRHVYIALPRPARARQDGRDALTMIHFIAHELGHVIGLPDPPKVTTCAVLNEGGYMCPRPTVPWQWRCRILERIDVRAAVRRFGGHVKDVGPAFCDKSPPPAPPTDAMVEGSIAASDFVTVSWRNSKSRHLDTVDVQIRKDTCPTATDDRKTYDFGDYPAKPGARQSVVIRSTFVDAPGRWCVALWSRADGRRSSTAATVFIDVPDRSTAA